MNTTWKRYLSVICAIALVLTLGVFSSDRYLMATDGDNDIVADASADASPAPTVVSEEVTIEVVDADVEEEIPAEDTEEAAEAEENADANASSSASGDAEEEEEAERSVVITSNLAGVDMVPSGTEVTFTATLYGYEDVPYTIQWQYSTDCNTWNNIEGANGLTYTVALTSENDAYYWRVVVDEVQ